MESQGLHGHGLKRSPGYHQDQKGKSGTEYLGEAMLRTKFITNIFSHISVGCVGLKL
jgi:hypothetical protein